MKNFKIGDKVTVIKLDKLTTDDYLNIDDYLGVSGVISEIQDDRSFSGIKTDYNIFVKFDKRSKLEDLYFTKDELEKC